MTVFYKSDNQNYRKVLTVPTIDVCKFAKMADENYLIARIKELADHAAPNFIHDCPYDVIIMF
jgi:Protein of unknown function (DUF1091)